MSKKFTLHFDTDNAVFDDGNLETATAEALRQVAENVERGAENGPIRDCNGNRIGNFSFIDVE